MIGIYFSGTGNTGHCVEKFLSYHGGGKIRSIEDLDILELISQSEEILLGYPIYFSNMPKIMKDFILKNKEIWKNKKIYIIATMGLFSGLEQVVVQDCCENMELIF